jgi:hypothetical protein
VQILSRYPKERKDKGNENQTNVKAGTGVDHAEIVVTKVMD